ncbi:hypothetical protein ABPG75_013361 [Micractinium tetrahymenae]
MPPRKQQAAGQVLDLLKQCGVDGWPRGDAERKGNVSVAVDRPIGRPVVRLAGAVPAANSLRLPRLASPHRFLYLQLRLEPGKTYGLHADFTTADRQPHRLSISNLFGGQAAQRSRRAGGLQIFLPTAHDAWTLLAIDLAAAAEAAAGGGGPCSGGGAGGGGSPYARLCSLQLCANMTVRGAFTSDVVFDWSTLPPNLAFSAAFDIAHARVLWVPAPPPAGSAHFAAPRPPRPASPRPPVPSRPASPQRRPPRQQRPAEEPAPGLQQQQQQLALHPSPIAQLERVAAFSGRHPGLLHFVPGSSNGGGKEVVYAAGSLIVTMQLACGGAVLQQQGQQWHLNGHARSVRALALSADGCRLASVEEGAGAAVRLWDLRRGLCLATVPGHASGTACLDLAPDGAALATAGVDAQGRQELACWDVSACWAAGGPAAAVPGRPQELARQASEYNIQAVRFLPHDPSRLVTCGKNSIRLHRQGHRLKDGQLRGLSVPMDGVPAERRPYSCGTLACPASTTVGEVFTCLAFEPAMRERPLCARRLFAGTASGALYTVDLEGRTVQGVAQAHAGALVALAAHDGFCVTGSADGKLRLWGGDLREAYMEAAHEGAVTGIGLSSDGLWVAVGTESGALSLLDVKRCAYSTLLRSHTAAVHAVALLGQPPAGSVPQGWGSYEQQQQQGQQQQQQQQIQYCTAGADGTVRVWSGTDHQQVLELTAPGETVLSLACHPEKVEVACGFQGGALRIFDAAGATLLQESRQHTGAVTQLAFARHGRVLLSLGEDGCVCAYDAQRCYMPTTFVLAGFPLHATAMAVSADGRLLAVAALSLRPGSAGPGGRRPPSPAGGKRGENTSASMAQAVIVLHSTLSMQLLLQLPVEGGSRVAQVQLLPDGRHVLALTDSGRLLGYRSSDGALVLDVPRCLGSPCLTSALDPSGSFLLAGTASGQLKVWGLASLHRLAVEESSCIDGDGQPQEQQATAPDVIRSLPCQERAAPAGSSVLGAAFLDPRRLLTVGSAGEVCCWSLCGEPWSPCSARQPGDVSTAGALVVRMPAGNTAAGASAGQPLGRLQPPPAHQQAVSSPLDRLRAACSSRRPATSPGQAATASVDAHSKEQQVPHQLLAMVAGSRPASPAPRPLPAVLQTHLPPRPPSAPPELPRHPGPPSALITAAADRLQSASLPSTPQRARRKQLPIWERYKKVPEASLVVTATPNQRCTKVVRQERQLRISSPAKKGGSGSGASTGGKRDLEQRSAEWVDAEVEGDRVPAYRPSQQLQLLPPSATVQRVVGFKAAAGFCWLPAGPQQLLYAAGNVLVAEEMSSAEQRHLARLPRDVSALAATADGRLVAAAVRPAAAGGSTADIHLVQLQGGAPGPELPVLCHHSFAVQALAFSPCGSLLASLAHSPDDLTSSLALWLVEEPEAAELVAGVELPGAVAGLAWEAPSPGSLPVFYTAGSQGLTQWQLEPEALTSTAVHIPAVLRGVALTAVATCCAPAREEEEEENQGSGASTAGAARLSRVYVGDASGRVWQLEVDSGQDVRQARLLSEVPGQGISCLCATAPHLLAVGIATGSLLLLTEDSASEGEASWKVLAGEQLDGTVQHLHVDAGRQEVTAATAAGTLWGIPAGSDPTRVLLCGQQRRLSSWHLAAGAEWKRVPPTVALASAAGVAVWPLGREPARAPLVEFPQPAGATHASLADDASVCAAAYADGGICLYDVAQARLRWRSTGAAAQGGVAALAVFQRLRGCKVLAAYRSGALLLLDGASGQVAHRTLQFAVRQESGRLCPSNFPVTGLAAHPADPAVFALAGQQHLLVCKAAWTKTATITPLARLSFGPASGTAAAPLEEAPPPAEESAGQEAPSAAAAAVRVAFSRAHPGHLYCSNPAAPGQLLLLDYTTQAVVKTLLAPVADSAAITSLALHPTEALLAAGTSAGTVLLLRLETEAWAELAAHAEGAAVVGLGFSPCGRRLFSAAAGACATLCWELGQ